jgi:phosphatidylserine decarboxylase
MSPFDVHYNRAPLSGLIEFIRHYPALKKNLNMGHMHLRTLIHKLPYYENSLHIMQNERTITKMNCSYSGKTLSCYLIQIGGRTVNRVVSYFREGDHVERGDIFGMIRMGSQVDIVVPHLNGMQLMVQPGQKVRAGETILIE